MALSLVSYSSANGGLTQVTSVAITAPVSISSGNLLVAEVTGDSSGVITPPSGWTLYNSISASVDHPGISIYWKAATGSEPSSYTWTISTTGGLMVSMFNISGASVTTPFNGFFTARPSSAGETAGATSGTPSIPTSLGCLPLAFFTIQQLNPSNTGSPTGLTAGWSGEPVNVAEDVANYNNIGNGNGYNATFAAIGPLTSSTSTAVTVSCTWGGAYSNFTATVALLFVNPAAISYGTLTAYPYDVDLIGTGVSKGMRVSLVETNYTGAFSVTVPTVYQSIVSVSSTQGGTYGTSCSVSGPTNSFWMQGLAPGAFQIDVAGG